MISSTITVRMDESKKKHGNAILKKRGLTPSQWINELYDYMLEEGEIPWEQNRDSVFSMPQEEIESTWKTIKPIPVKSRFSSMTDEEIELERLRERNLI